MGGLAAGFFEELGWTGFALPKMQLRHSALAAALMLGVTWAMWHFLADFWGGFDACGTLYLPHFLLWVVALTAYRVLITWVYNNSGSLLLAMLMHASFTGSQAILGPSAAPASESVRWYAVFAAALWVVVAIVATAYGKRLVRQPLQAIA